MRVTFRRKLALLISVWRTLPLLPRGKRKFFLASPVDCTRYWEFPYLLDYLAERKMRGLEVLDISSPVVMSYLLARENRVMKTDINPSEGALVREGGNLSFRCEDGTNLSFDDASFDLVYSISVIEHIYHDYSKAVAEMVRVTRPGGHVFLTFPVASRHAEEWTEGGIYSNQFRNGGKTFFQYRFSRDDVQELLDSLAGVEVVESLYYRERWEGAYDQAMDALRTPVSNRWLKELKRGLVNLAYGMTMLDDKPASFDTPGRYGNLLLMLRKTEGRPL